MPSIAYRRLAVEAAAFKFTLYFLGVDPGLVCSDTGAMQLLANEGATAHQLVHSLPAILHVLAGRAEPTVADLQGILGRWHFLAV